MRVSDLDYELPAECIAQQPTAEREQARLLQHRVRADVSAHLAIADLPQLLAPGDLLVVNDTLVLPARLLTRRASGGSVELLVLADPERARTPRALVRPARRVRPGEVLTMDGEGARIVLGEREADAAGRPTAIWTFALEGEENTPAGLHALLLRSGRMPLPPYVRRSDERAEPSDRERYQTVYARRPGAAAAPTAGLHLSTALIGELDARGIELASVTLHVGLGTFQPVQTETLDEHPMHEEWYDLPVATAQAIERCRERGGRVCAVGTTSLRVLETQAAGGGRVHPGSGTTRLFLRPGMSLRVADALLTNFHLPRTTLLALVATIAGSERVLRLYREAIERGYRFFSYGDAMLLEDYARRED